MSTVEAPAQPVAQPVTRADVLHRAADLLEEFGWTRGDLGNKRRGFCLLGAVLEAQNDFGGDYDPQMMSEISDLLWRGLPNRGGGLAPVNWNNDPSRTKAEVVARLRQAANASPL